MKTFKALLGVAIFVVAFGILHHAAVPAAKRECFGLTSEQCVNRLYAPTKMQFYQAVGDGFREVWIAADGVITKETPEDFKAFLQKHPNLYGSVIRLDSPGGSLDASLQLGEIFRLNKLATVVGSTSFTPGNGNFGVATKTPGSCMSGCAIAFLGGVTRSALAGELGFHQFYRAADAPALSAAETAAHAEYSAGELAKYLKRMGVDPEVLTLALMTPADQIATPDQATLIRLRIVMPLWALPPPPPRPDPGQQLVSDQPLRQMCADMASSLTESTPEQRQLVLAPWHCPGN